MHEGQMVRDTHRKPILFKLVCLCLIFINPHTFATNTKTELTLTQLTTIALNHNKDLQVARQSVAIAEARLSQAGRWSNPNLNLSNTDDRFFSHEGEYTRSIGFSQDFPVAGRLGAQQQVAQVDVVIAQSEIHNAERKLRTEVATNFYAIALLDARIQLDNRLLKSTQQLVKITRNRLQSGEVSVLDANATSLEGQRLSQEKNILLGQRLNQLANLNLLLGRTASTPILLHETIPSVQILPALPSLQLLAHQYRPDYVNAWLKLNRARASILLARSQRYADWTLGLAAQQNAQVLEGVPPQKSARALTLNLSIPIPLLNNGDARILEASSLGTQAFDELSAQRLTITDEVAGNYAQLQMLAQSLSRAHQSLLPLSVRNLQIAKKAYQSGQLSLLDVLQTQRQQNDAEAAFLNTLDQYCQTWVKLENSVGLTLSRLPKIELIHPTGKKA